MEEPRRVFGVVRQLRDGTWIVSVELWTDSLIVHWVQATTPRSERYIPYSGEYAPFRPTAIHRDSWSCVDDVGTEYEATPVGWESSDESCRGRTKFTPPPPTDAATLTLSLEGDEVAVTLAG